jgi:hypothetical protein
VSILDIRLLGAAMIVTGLGMLFFRAWLNSRPKQPRAHGVIDFNRHESRAALRRMHGRRR